MKLLLNILIPMVYEFIDPEMLDSVVFVTYPDLTPGSEGLREHFSSSGLWRDSRCIGIDFREKLRTAGYDIEEYDRDCSYILSMIATKALLSDIKNYPEAAVILDQPLDTKDETKKIHVYEFTHRETNNSVILINPRFDSMEMQVLPCIQKTVIELDVASQDAVDYFTKESLYIYKDEQLEEVRSAFPGITELDDLQEGYYILRWEGILKESPWSESEGDRPWRIKLETLKTEIEKILETNTCIYLKDKRIKKLINKHYGNL